jgi:hypothetical protein
MDKLQGLWSCNLVSLPTVSPEPGCVVISKCVEPRGTPLLRHGVNGNWS